MSQEQSKTFSELRLCDECGAEINFGNGLALLSYPPKYQFPCNGCGDLKVFSHKDYITIQRAKMSGECT